MNYPNNWTRKKYKKLFGAQSQKVKSSTRDPEVAH